jgi:hypothetical protein
MNLCLILTCAFDYEKANVKIRIQIIVTSKAWLLNLESLPIFYAVVVVFVLDKPQDNPTQRISYLGHTFSV